MPPPVTPINELSTLAKKLKLLTFSRNWEIRLVLTKVHHHDTTRRMLKIAILESIISEHDIIQPVQITTEKFFFFVYHKLGWDMEQK